MTTFGFTLGVIILFITAIVMVMVVVYKVTKTEKIKKEFDKTMQVGDSVDFHVVSGSTQNGIITKVNKDTVVIVTSVPKRFVYPANKKKN